MLAGYCCAQAAEPTTGADKRTSAPSQEPRIHDVDVWLNYKDAIGFNTASLAPVANYSRKGRAMAFTGPAIAVDWLEVEGPIHDTWPPPGHKALFGDLPFAELKPPFERAFTVPEGTKADALTAEYADGVLRVHLPKTETVKPKPVEIKVA